MNNDMANGVIKNAQTIAFRGSTKNLGDNLTGVLAIDCSIADVHIGKLNGDVILDFQKWAPAGTRGTVEVIFTVTTGQKIEITDAIKYGVKTIKGYTVPSAGNPYIIVPAGVDRVHYVFSSLDCGTTIEINQVDDSRVATRIKVSSPVSNGVATLTFNGTNSVTASQAVNHTAGTILYTTEGIEIGIVSTTTTTTTILLINPTTRTDTIPYLFSSKYGRVGDTKGDIITDGSYIYVCSADYTDGTSPIWIKTSESDTTPGYVRTPRVELFAPAVSTRDYSWSHPSFAYYNNDASQMHIFAMGVLTDKDKWTLNGTVLTYNAWTIADGQYDVLPSVISVDTSGVVTPSGDITGADVTASGNLSVSGNASVSGNLVSSSGNITATNGYIKGKIVGTTQSGQPTGAAVTGQILIQTNGSTTGTIWVCIAGGNPGVWKSATLS
jgi:hypothetical protein